MNIKWYTNNYDRNTQSVTSNYQIVENFLGNYPDSKKDLIYLIIKDKLVRNSLFSKFIENVNIFNNFDIKLGLINSSENQEPSILLDQPTFFVGGQENYESLLKLPKEKLVISSYGHDDLPTIAYQRHLSDSYNTKSISLGELNQSTERAESIIRNAETILFDINAIRRQESFHASSKITGITLLQACTLSRFAGMASKPKIFFLNIGNEDICDEIEELIALIFWYYLEGRKFSKIESEPQDSKTYMVENLHFKEAVKFIKGKTTGRWSYIHPISNKMIPCTEAEYKAFSNGEIIESMFSLQKED